MVAIRLSVFSFLLIGIAACASRQSLIYSPALPDDLHDIEMINRKTGYLYTYGTGKIFKTVDGGRAWAIIASLEPLFFEQMSFLSEKEGWLVGEKGRVYHTQDGGTTWQDKSLDKGDELIYAAYFDQNTTLVQARSVRPREEAVLYEREGEKWEVWPGKLPFVYQIKKQGKTFWASGRGIYQRLDGKWLTMFSDSTTRTGAIRDLLVSGNKIFAVSANGYLLRSEDGGHTWDTQQITNNRLRSMVYHKDWLIIAGDRNKSNPNLFFSDNGGQDWQERAFSQDIHRMESNSKRVFAAGKKGQVFSFTGRGLMLDQRALFAGEIGYTLHYEGKNTEEYPRLYGDTVKAIFNHGQMRYDFNGSITRTHWFNYPSSKRWMKLNTADSLIVTDLSVKNTDSIQVEKVGGEKVMGIKCKGLKYTVWKNGKVLFKETVFTNARAAGVDPRWFEQIQYLADGLALRQNASLPLKRIIEYADYRITWQAFSIERKVPDPELFIPKG